MIGHLMDRLIAFPLWEDDGKAIVDLNDVQKRHIQSFLDKLEAGVYRLEPNPCLCGASDNSSDVIIARKDRYGLPCENVLCGNCGLIRIKERLDERSTADFYKNEYRGIYVGSEVSSADFFNDQAIRGEGFYERIAKNVDISSIQTVFEIGCGAGGILYPFFKNNKRVSGCDFGEQYLKFGRDKGLDLYSGELDLLKTPVGSQDLVILSHVMEHFGDPVSSMNRIIEVVSPDKYLLIEVPGIFAIMDTYFNPILYFQNAHVHNYYYYYLKTFFAALGLEILFGDERCTFLLRKPILWKKAKNIVVRNRDLKAWAIKVEHELKKCYLLHKFKMNPFYYKQIVVQCLDFFGIKDNLKRLLGKV